MTKPLTTATLLGSVAALSLAFSAPAFAQVTEYETEPPVTTQEDMSDTLEEAADDIEDVANELEDETETTTDEFSNELEDTMQTTDDVVTWDADVDTKTDTEETTPVTCPEGTELKDDGSCMATGEWEPQD